MKAEEITRTTAASDIAAAINAGGITDLLKIDWYKATDHYRLPKTRAIFELLTDKWKGQFIKTLFRLYHTSPPPKYITEEIPAGEYGRWEGKDYMGHRCYCESISEDGQHHYLNLEFDAQSYIYEVYKIWEAWATSTKSEVEGKLIIAEGKLQAAEEAQAAAERLAEQTKQAAEQAAEEAQAAAEHENKEGRKLQGKIPPDLARLDCPAFWMAVEKGLITETATGLKWNGRKVALAYFLHEKIYKKQDYFPASRLKKLFNVTLLTQRYNQIEDSVWYKDKLKNRPFPMPPPSWAALIDALPDNNR